MLHVTSTVNCKKTYGSVHLRNMADCSICYEILESDIKTLDCAHVYHKGCIERWCCRANTCPLCRAIIDDHELGAIPSYLTMSSFLDYEEASQSPPYMHGYYESDFIEPDMRELMRIVLADLVE